MLTTPRRVAKGEPVENILTADFFNSLIDGMRRTGAVDTAGRTAGVGGTPPTTLVKANNLGPDLPFGSIVRPTGAATSFETETDRYQFRRSPFFNIGQPVSSDDPVFIVTGRINQGAIGDVAISGIAVTRIDVTDANHHYAKPKAGVTSHLQSAESGPARILIKHPPDDGQIGWAVVHLADSPFSMPVNRVTIPVAYCDGDELKYYPICLEGVFQVVSCDESSSSSQFV